MGGHATGATATVGGGRTRDPGQGTEGPPTWRPVFGRGPHQAHLPTAREHPPRTLGGREGATHAAMDADQLGVVLEGHAPADDPPVGPLTALLDQREHPRHVLGDHLIDHCRV